MNIQLDGIAADKDYYRRILIMATGVRALFFADLVRRDRQLHFALLSAKIRAMTAIRPFQDADLEPLRAIFNEIVERGDAFVYDSPLTPQQMRDYLASYSAAFVAESDGQILGGYVLRPNQPARGSHIGNGTYLVASSTRGRGIGKLLGEHSLQEARRMGFTALQFNAVVADNERAVATWKRLGFTVVGTSPRAFRHADGHMADLLIMHREL